MGEAASDSLSQLGAAMISAWGVVALAKETWAPEALFPGKTMAKSDGRLEHPGKIRRKIGQAWENAMENAIEMEGSHGKAMVNAIELGC